MTFAVILPHPMEPLTLRTDTGELPVFEAESLCWRDNQYSLLGALEDELQLRAHVRLRLAGVASPVVLESLDPDWAPPIGFRWGEAETIPADNRLRVPWARPGWIAEVVGWLEGILGPLKEPPKLIRSWSLSCVLRAETAKGRYYLKAATLTQPLFANEAVVTPNLAAAMPGAAPLPIAVDATRGWLLLEDFGAPVGQEGTPQILADAPQSLHAPWSGRTDELLALGCVDRRLPILRAQLDDLLAHPDEWAFLTTEERQQLLTIDWDARFSALDARKIPDSLQHGDLHGGNVAKTETGFLYFDWTDASVGCPYFDLLEALFADDPAPLLEGYFLSQDFEEIWKIVRPLAALHHAMSYRSIERHVEPCSVHEHSGNFPALLRFALA